MKKRNNFHPDEIDPRLYDLLDQLRQTPARNPEVVERGRKNFLAEMESLGLATPARSRGNRISRWFAGVFNKNSANGEVFTVKGRNPRYSLASAVIMVTLLVFLFGSAGTTALASQASLPGDVLYPLKIGLEQARLTIAGDAPARLELQMEYAERRLSEIASLVGEGRFDHIASTASRFEAQIRNLQIDIEAISQENLGQAEVLDQKYTQVMTRYALTLNSVLDQVPESLQLELRHALQYMQGPGKTSEHEFSGVIERIGQDTWEVAGRTITMNTETEMRGPFAVGDIARVRVYQETGGHLIAREVERVRADLANENENENTNINTNTNGNQNTNQAANDNSMPGTTNDNQTQERFQNQDQNQTQNQNLNANGNDAVQNMNQNGVQDSNQNDNQSQPQDQNNNQVGNQNGSQDSNQNDNQSQPQNQEQHSGSNNNGDD